jgi:hypothetical protein
MMHSEYKEVLSILIRNQVEFMIVGAYALAYHGVPRSTGGIDVSVRCSERNSRLIHRSLAEFGAPIKGLDDLYLTRPGKYFQIGVAPFRIDILNQIDGVEYDQVVCEEADIEGLRLKIISRRDFIANKRASGRMKDLADIESLGEL